MADNVTITPGTGTTIAADECPAASGVLFQRTKTTWGPDGTANDVDVASGKAMPVQVRSATGLVPIGEPTDAKATATDTTSVTAISIWKQISASVQALNTAIGSTLWDLGIGTGGSRTQRIAIDTSQLGTLGANTMTNSVPVTIATNQTAGTFWQTTQPVSGTFWQTTQPVSGTFWQATQPVSGTVTVTNFGNALVRGAGASTSDTQRVTIDTGQVPPPSTFVSGAITTAMTATTTTSLLPAPGASLRNFVTTIVVSNAHATVGTDVVIQDGSGGTTLLTIPAAAVYGGAVITLPTPLRQPTANTAIFCANVTTGSSTKVSAVGYTAA